jgi:hypothetical protein
MKCKMKYMTEGFGYKPLKIEGLEGIVERG